MQIHANDWLNIGLRVFTKRIDRAGNKLKTEMGSWCIVQCTYFNNSFNKYIDILFVIPFTDDFIIYFTNNELILEHLCRFTIISFSYDFEILVNSLLIFD